ncbi:MAG: tetratricopeptide repeat protein [Cyclobacteriaceae bacterium]|nr:tetratricopeptide repeat protein [Cyclobacteriaceae bacterium]
MIDSLKQIVSLQKHDTVELEALLQLSNEFLRKDLKETKRYSFKIISLADTKEEVKWLAGAYNYLVTVNQQIGKIDSATYFLGLSETVTKQNPNNSRMQYNFNQAAGLFYKNIGEFNRAMPYMLNNLKQWPKEDENKAGLLLNLGNLHISLGNYKKATDFHLQSLRIFEQTKNLRGQSFCLHSLGNDFFNLNRLTEAKEYYSRSLDLKEKLGDKRGSVNSIISLGDVYKDLNQFSQADAYYQKALGIVKDMNLVADEARVLYQQGLMFVRMKETQFARNAFLKSMDLFKQAGDSISFIKSKSEIRNLEQAELQLVETEKEMLKGLHMLIRVGDQQQEGLEYARLSEFYTTNKNFEKALYYLKKHQSLTDSVEGKTVLLQVKELEEKYNSEKKEREIELLKKDQQLKKLELERQRSQTGIIIIVLISVVIIGALLINRYRVINRLKRQEELERMRQKIAKDLHDDMGSTLSSINIMSKVAMNESNNVLYLQKISTYSARIMETMSDMVWSINPGNDSLEQVIVRMREFANEVLDSQHIEFELTETIPQGIVLDSEKRKNIFLIFKEAINNAAKYSQAKNVRVTLAYSQNHLFMKVSDDGIGFDVAQSKSGNGLRNLQTRAKEIGGELTINSSVDSGTLIDFKLSVNQL